MQLITESKLRLIARKIGKLKAIEISKILNEICPTYGIVSKDIFEDFLPNVLHESGQFSLFTENLNYSVEALIAKFGRHRISIENANKFGRTTKQKANQQAIAMTIYGGKWGKQNLGNLATDGWELRGSGAMQITGRYMGENFRIYINKKLSKNFTLVEIFELLRTNLAISIEGACWVFAIEKKLIDEAIADQVITIRRAINGGVNGLEDVRKFLALCQRHL